MTINNKNIDKLDLEVNKKIKTSLSIISDIKNASKIKNKILNTQNLGIIKTRPHNINTINDVGIFHSQYRVPLSLLKNTKAEIDRLIKTEIIRKSNSKYAFLAFPILKKNGNIRIVVDYRK
ncbi:Pro-Pol polyprotein [Dictyocoela muelleri]|nr:Pro-Pol polyprotein [Dictyocoela muelleri]